MAVRSTPSLILPAEMVPPEVAGKVAGSVVGHPSDMSFDNAYFTPTYYVIAVEHEPACAARNGLGTSPRSGATTGCLIFTK